MRKTGAKKVEINSIVLYEGDWINGDFVITRYLNRSDLTTPSVKPAFIVYLTNNERILVGWTTKGSSRLFYIKDYIRDETNDFNSLPGFKSFTLKVVRMRGPQWQKITKVVKRGMARWFQGENVNSSPLYDTEMISVQPMTTQPSVLFDINYKPPKI